MKMIKSNSSMISEYGYDHGNKQMRVVYSNGSTYIYYDVSKRDYEAFMTAKSKGQYISSQIKPNYNYKKM